MAITTAIAMINPKIVRFLVCSFLKTELFIPTTVTKRTNHLNNLFNKATIRWHSLEYPV